MIRTLALAEARPLPHEWELPLQLCTWPDVGSCLLWRFPRALPLDGMLFSSSKHCRICRAVANEGMVGPSSLDGARIVALARVHSLDFSTLQDLSTFRWWRQGWALSLAWELPFQYSTLKNVLIWHWWEYVPTFCLSAAGHLEVTGASFLFPGMAVHVQYYVLFTSTE